MTKENQNEVSLQNTKLRLNRVALFDTYKHGHFKQYKKGTVGMFDYAEARSNKQYDSVTVVGLQYLMESTFSWPIEQWEVDECAEDAVFSGVDFDYEGWTYLVNELGGKLPVEIRALPEGTIAPIGVPLFTVKSTDERMFHVVSGLETILMTVWSMMTVATKTRTVLEMLQEFADKTQENPWIYHSFHNFGSRGATVHDAATVAGIGHILAGCLGTDTFQTMRNVRHYYNVPKENSSDICGSINATEHSVQCSEGRDGEFEVLKRHIMNNKGKMLEASVADSFNYLNHIEEVTKEDGELRKLIEEEDSAIHVARPDSGKHDVILNQTLDIFEKNNVPFTVNSKGYKVFDKYRIIWGDGTNYETMKLMLELFEKRKYSTENIAFGSGGWLVQMHNRDTLGFAIKNSQLTVKNSDGSTTNVNVSKDPITDPGKKSKEGEITTYFNKETNTYFYDLVNTKFEVAEDAMETIWRNGDFIKKYDMYEVRERCKI